MLKSNLARTSVAALLATLFCIGCGDSQPAQPEKPKKQSGDGTVNYCPERAKLIREGDELYRQGNEAFNKWGTTREDADIKESVRLLNESYDKYREAKDEYGVDKPLERKIQRNNFLRMRARKHTPI